jgi:hypothetical protein
MIELFANGLSVAGLSLTGVGILIGFTFPPSPRAGLAQIRSKQEVGYEFALRLGSH